MQAVIHRWYTHNLFELGAAPFALAVIFYLLPKLAGRPLYSRALALVGFWLLVFCGAWGGFRPADPFPSWLSSVSLVARVFVLVALLAFGLNWSRTLTGAAATVRSDPLLQFTIFGAASYILAAVLDALGALPDINRLTAFTLFEQGIAQLRIHGFLIMTLMAAVYHITPRLAQAAWPSPRLIRLHFWCAGLGTVLTTLALVIGGLVQGAGIDQPAKDFLAVMRSTVPFLGTSTLGVTLLLVGYGAFLVHLKQLLSINGPCCQFWRWRGNQAQEGEGITG